MSLERTLNISLNSLRNNQYALSVVSHNVANLNTEGYAKKSVNFEENIVGNYGSDVYSRIKNLDGSVISNITDYMDESALNDIAKSTSDADFYNTLSDALNGLEDLIDPLSENGIIAALDNFYTAASNLEQFPDDVTIRQQYVYAAQDVCEKFNDTAKGLNNYQSSLISDTKDNVQIVNGLLEQIASSNESYINNGKDSSVLDATYGYIQELSSYIDVHTEKNTNGTLNVYIGNNKVVQGSKVNYTLEAESNTTGSGDNILTLSLKSTQDENFVITDGVNDAIKKGKIGAAAEFLNGTNKRYANIDDIKAGLNNAAAEFAKEINSIQKYDDGTVFAASITTVDGEKQLEKANPDIDMFVSNDTQPLDASNITVNSEISNNVFLVSAARIDLSKYEEGSDEWKKAVGNSSNVFEILKVRDKEICDYGGEQDNVTVSDLFSTIAAKTGLDASSIKNKAQTYNDILTKAKENYSNNCGVNIDEEIADLLKYQRAYEASARVFATANSLYDIIFGMI